MHHLVVGEREAVTPAPRLEILDEDLLVVTLVSILNYTAGGVSELRPEGVFCQLLPGNARVQDQKTFLVEDETVPFATDGSGCDSLTERRRQNLSTDVNHPDGVTGYILERLVRGLVPGVHDIGDSVIGLALHDGLVDRARVRNKGSHGPLAVRLKHVGRNPEQLAGKELKNGCSTPDTLLDGVHEIKVPVDPSQTELHCWNGDFALLAGHLIHDGDRLPVVAIEIGRSGLVDGFLHDGEVALDLVIQQIVLHLHGVVDALAERLHGRFTKNCQRFLNLDKSDNRHHDDGRGHDRQDSQLELGLEWQLVNEQFDPPHVRVTQPVC